MRIPQRPPSFKEMMPKLLKQLTESTPSSSAIADAMKPTVKGRYLHWDKLRHLQPPSGLTREEWWCAIKLARFPQQQVCPFTDNGGNPFRYGLPDPATEYLHNIDQQTGGRLEMSNGEAVNPSARDGYLVHSLVEEAITSSQLEGATTTRVVAKEMIRSQRPPRDESEQMILNNYYAMKMIRQCKDQPLSEEMLLKLHRVLTDKTTIPPKDIGRFRLSGEPVAVYDMQNELLHSPPPAERLKKRLELMYKFANGETPDYFIHPLVRGVILHFWLAYEHPFVDGNGRCARALFYWAMLRQGAWLCEFLSISQIIRKAPAKYGRAFLYTETDDNDLTYFIFYHLDVIHQAIDELQEYIKKKSAALRAVQRTLRKTEHFNHRQIDLLSHALRHPDAEYTIVSHQSSHGVVYQTARTDLWDLARRGLLEEYKIGRTFCYKPVRDLEYKLKEPQ